MNMPQIEMRAGIIRINGYGFFKFHRSLRKSVLVLVKGPQLNTGQAVLRVQLKRLAQCRLGLG